MTYALLLIVFALGMGVGCYSGEKLNEHTFVDYELDGEEEYPPCIDCEDESDNLYI